MVDLKRILLIAGETGRIMLENGAETYRVEEVITRISHGLGVHHAESFVTPTGIFVSLTDINNNTLTLVERVKQRSTDLEKITRINNLSRKIGTMAHSIDDVEAELRSIKAIKKLPSKLILPLSAAMAASFAYVYGGTIYDCLAAFMVGGLVRLATILLGNARMNDFFINIVGGATAALFALIFHALGISASIDKVIIGSIMQLVPGLAITNGIRDTITGDLLSGIARSVESFLIAVAIAVGAGIVLKLWIDNFSVLLW